MNRTKIKGMGIQKLPRAVSAAIVSTSSIQSQLFVLKELIENAIDAMNNNSGNANNQVYIEIDKDSAGLDYILVKDNGYGVIKSDRKLMCLNGTTSKITSINDLSSGVSTCGFRGEALHFIARLAKRMEISTKTTSDLSMETWTVNTSGLPNSDSKSMPGVNGTTIKVFGLFKNAPVRYTFLKEKKTKIIKSIEDIILEYVMIYRNIRFQLRYVKLASSGKIINGNCKSYPSKISKLQLFYNILETRKKDWLFEKTFELKITDIHSHETFIVGVSIIMPRMRIQDIGITKRSIKILSVNNRPLDLNLNFGKSISNKILGAYMENSLLNPVVWFVSLTIPLDKVDVNIEPGKSDIIICDEEVILTEFGKEVGNIIKEETNLDSKLDECKNNYIDNMILPDEMGENPSETLQNSEDNLHTLVNTSIYENDNIVTNELSFEDIFPIHSDVQHLKNTFLQSSDDSLIEEFDLTLKNLENQSQKNGSLRSYPTETNENFFVKEIKSSDDKTDSGWSHTAYDETLKSMEHEDNQAVVNLIHKSQSQSELNTSSINDKNNLTESKATNILNNPIHSDRKNAPKNSNCLAVLNENKATTMINVEKAKIKSNDQSENKEKSVKQVEVTNYITYHMNPTKMNGSSYSEPKLPKIFESTQNTYEENLKVKFEFTLDKIERNYQLANDESWINRSGVPSLNLISTVLNLYEKNGHIVATKNPLQIDSEIYCLK